MAKSFRDDLWQDVLVLIDNIFHFAEAGAEVSGLTSRHEAGCVTGWKRRKTRSLDPMSRHRTQRQANGEGRALADFAVDSDPAAMHLDD